jgi:hypothetical protein
MVVVASDSPAAASTEGLAITLSVLDQTLCRPHNHSADTLTLRMRAIIKNNRLRPVILANRPGPVFNETVMDVSESGRVGSFVASWGGGVELRGSKSSKSIPQLSSGEYPDPTEFSVVPPRKVHELTVTTWREVSREPTTPVRERMLRGKDYYLQFDVNLWPFRTTSDELTEILRSRWRPIGDLISGPVKSDFVRFSVPSLDQVILEPCPQTDK